MIALWISLGVWFLGVIVFSCGLLVSFLTWDEALVILFWPVYLVRFLYRIINRNTMIFVIKVTYKDGDSFNSYLDHETIDYNWENEKVVIENMIALKEHYEAYRKDNNCQEGDDLDFDPKTRWWYSKPTYGRDNIDPGINLKRDDGSLFYYRCPWCGYFASLQDLTMGIKEFKIEL